MHKRLARLSIPLSCAAHHAQPALEDYTADKISEEELAQRKRAAREQANGDNPLLVSLDQAFDAHAAAGKAQALAANAEVAAAAELVYGARACREGAGPGSSGQLLRRRTIGCGQKRVSVL